MPSAQHMLSCMQSCYTCSTNACKHCQAFQRPAECLLSTALLRVPGRLQAEAEGVVLESGDHGMLGGKYGIRTYGVSSSCRAILKKWASLQLWVNLQP
jgi:hypothetical protein